MSQAGVVTRLAVRELWITFRLLLLLAGFVGVAAAVALLPAPLPVLMQRLAFGLGMAAILAGMVAAWSLAEERARGRAGWLVTRAVSRGTLLVGWFVALAMLALAGTAIAGVLGWLTASGVSFRLDPAWFAAMFVGVAATALAAIALGLLLGAALPAPVAVGATIALAAVTGALGRLVPGAGELLPGASLVELAALGESTASSASTWRATGVALLATAVLLAAARVALDRVEL